ncbi:MAG: hypothetical protein KBT48_08195 [Firmicutes bacterium]|nr:hypothetical protein [Bacillota bacterium]
MAKSSIQFSREEKASIREEVRKKYAEITQKLEEPGVREVRDIFIEKFILCETLYKMVLKKYLIINKKYNPNHTLTIQILQVKTALSLAGYSFEDNLLEKIFSGAGIYKKRGSKSAKLLRNGIEHEMNKGDLQEVLDRQNELLTDMDHFLHWIQE